MKTYSASSIVLSRTDLGEKDRILTLYTREYGKLSAVSKGCRRPGSKLSGASEPFTFIKMLASRGRDLDTISQADVRESFPNVKCNILSTAYGIYMLELVRSFVDERQPSEELFDTLLSSMYVLENGAPPELCARYMELHVLDILGYKPHFSSCMRCGDRLDDKTCAFSPGQGGTVCCDCGQAPNDAIWVPGHLYTYVDVLENTPPNGLAKLNFPKGAMRDLSKTFKWHIRCRLEHDLKSTDFISVISGYEENGVTDDK